MLLVFIGTDRTKARAAADAALKKLDAKRPRVVVTDAHAPADLDATLQGGGLFGSKSSVLLDSVLSNEEMRERLTDALPSLKESEDNFALVEEKLDAATKKLLGKYAEKVEQFDLPKVREAPNTVFAIANAMRRGDKKAAWVALQRELQSGKAPEAIHGVMFWAAKDMVLKGRADEAARGRVLAAELAELPHAARRRGFELEYALERFLLSRISAPRSR